MITVRRSNVELAPAQQAVVELLSKSKVAGKFKVVSVPDAREPFLPPKMFVSFDLGRPASGVEAIVALAAVADAIKEGK